jgi:hypothetical protein
MQRILWRLAAASGVAVSLAFAAGPAGAASGDSWHRPEPTAVQFADQAASTHQDADSYARSVQFLPINANVPVQFLGFGHNGGDTRQSNHSAAWSSAENEAWTGQSVDQDQHAKGGWSSGPAFQGAEQDAETKQDAESRATSKQIAPINVNAPIQVLSFGSNGGDTYQSNNSTAKSSAENEAETGQQAGQSQHGGSGPAVQGAEQDAETKQYADSSAQAEQFLPVNANVPVQILSFGHNGGDTQQSNNSAAGSSAENEAGTGQSIGQAQGVGGLLG